MPTPNPEPQKPTHNPRGAGRKPTGNARERKVMIRMNEAEWEAYQQIGPDKLRSLMLAAVDGV